MFLNRVNAMMRQSAVRLTLSLMLVFGLVSTLAGFATYQLVQRETNRIADARLMAQAALIETALRSGADLPAPAFGQDYIIVTQNGVEGSLPFPRPNQRDGLYSQDLRGPDFRYLIRTMPSGVQLVLSENVDRQDEMLDTLSGGLQVSLLGMLIAGAIAGVWFARRGQKRLDLVSQGLGLVAQGRLDTRITLPGRQDDLSVLAERINVTTDRLAQSMEQMRVQTSNIAHDLRTPLARLRASVETSLTDLTQHQTPVDAQTLDAALDQIDHIVGTFNALLRLSRIESGAGKTAFEPVDLGALVETVAETFAPVIEDQGQSLRVEITNPTRIMGDRDLLVQVLANLIQNALRHGAAGQTITLRAQHCALSVEDQGPGIAPDERDKVLQPLYQLEKTRQSDGFGLGLAMVAAVSALHDAALCLTQARTGRGLAVVVTFPKVTKL